MLNCWVANMHDIDFLDKSNIFIGQFVLILVKSLITVVMQHFCEYILCLGVTTLMKYISLPTATYL